MTTFSNIPQSASTQAIAEDLLRPSRNGSLIVLDEDALSRRSVCWADLARALNEVLAIQGLPLLWVDCGGGEHGNGQWLARNFGGPHLSTLNDYDPDFGPIAAMDINALDPDFPTFGTSTLTCVAKRLQWVERDGASGIVVFDAIAGARPYNEIAARQLDITDRALSEAAREATFGWRACDLAAFAHARTGAITIVVTHDDDPGRKQLVACADRVVPPPRDESLPAAS